MKIKSFLLVGLIVLICSLGVLSLMGRLGNDQEYWRPADMYSTLGGSQGSSYSTVSYGSSAYASADALAVPSSRSMLGRRASFSYAHASMPAYSQSPIAGTASYSQGGLYTTSSADFHSFGGGGNGAMAAMSTSSSRKSVAATSAPIAMTVAMPSTSVFAQNTRSVNAADALSSISGDIAMASSYAGIGNTTGSRGMSGRKNVGGIQNNYLGWLSSGLWGYGGGYDGVTEDMLRALYVAATGDTDFSNQQAWDAFLAWFNSKQSDDTFGWYWAPISDAIPFLLLLCAIYAWVVYRKAKKQQSVEQC